MNKLDDMMRDAAKALSQWTPEERLAHKLALARAALRFAPPTSETYKVWQGWLDDYEAGRVSE